jgi:hypothetical protein
MPQSAHIEQTDVQALLKPYVPDMCSTHVYMPEARTEDRSGIRKAWEWAHNGRQLQGRKWSYLSAELLF